MARNAQYASRKMGFFFGLCFSLLIPLVRAQNVLPAAGARQLPYAVVPAEALGLPTDLMAQSSSRSLSREIPGRRIPNTVAFADLSIPSLVSQAVPLPEANTLVHVNYQARRFGQLQTASGQVRFFNPEAVLVKFRSQPHVSVLRVETNREWEAVQALSKRNDVQFAELDMYERRAYVPDDPLLTSQWHHQVIGSYKAWNYGLGSPGIRIAIVDTPFQMNHPDLAANTVAGWDVVANAPVTSSAGIVHSTMCAGLAAAVINNGTGIDGAVNCQILPINISGAISEMYNAIIWAADHGVRVVNISWTGGTDDSLEVAGQYLKNNAGGILAMAAYDGSGPMNGTNQPDIYCISMTDAADNFENTQYGSYIDFAAPGWRIYSTTTGGGYTSGSGTSYATPLFCGVVADILSINPTLKPDEVIQILQTTAVPLGSSLYYGAGRIDYGAAAAAAAATLPNIVSVRAADGQMIISATYKPGLNYTLLRTTQLLPPTWLPVTNAASSTNAGLITFTDTNFPSAGSFYRIQASVPPQ